MGAMQREEQRKQLGLKARHLAIGWQSAHGKRAQMLLDLVDAWAVNDGIPCNKMGLGIGPKERANMDQK